MHGPHGFIERQGEVYQIRRGGQTTEAKGLPHTSGRKHVGFLPDADVKVDDILYGTVSHNEFRVIEVENQNYGRMGVVINAYYENLNKAPAPSATTSINTINVQTMSNSTVQQASPGASQTLTFTNQQKVDAQEIVTELMARVGELGLDEKQQHEVTAEAETIKAQLKLESPKKFIIQECFNGIKGTIQSAVKAGGSDLGAWFVKQIEQLQAWQS